MKLVGLGERRKKKCRGEEELNKEKKKKEREKSGLVVDKVRRITNDSLPVNLSSSFVFVFGGKEEKERKREKSHSKNFAALVPNRAEIGV